MTCGMAFLGAPLNSSSPAPSNTTLLGCEVYCDSQPACIALNYAGSSCAYLSSVTGLIPKNGSIAVWKGNTLFIPL
jgi:hypothetical protein